MGTRPPGPWGGQGNPASAATVASASPSQPQSVASKNGFSLSRVLSEAATSVESAATSVAATLKVKAEDLEKGIKGNLEGAFCIFAAGLQAEIYAADAIVEETGCQIRGLIDGIIPGLMQMLKVVGATTVLGAGIGGAVGLFAGGALAAPGLVVGGELGFDIGMAALTWMGLAFLVEAIAEGFVELYETLHDGVEWAWQAKSLKGEAQKEQLDRAAHKMAKAAGILFRLVLQGILAYLLKKAAMGATRGALATGRAFATQGARATADASVAEVVSRLRASKFGDGFAKWVEDNWRDLQKNPKLQPKGTSSAGTAAAEGGGGSSAETPQPPKQRGSGASGDEPTGSEESQTSKSKDTPQVTKNARAGREFENKGLDHLQETQTDVQSQVSVRPYINESGELANYRVRLDAFSRDAEGNLHLTDFKSSDTAGLTPNQKVGYPLLEKYGGQVVGNNGGAAYPAGFDIPPTEVDIIKPGDF